jgi:HK97 family phage portal protein
MRAMGSVGTLFAIVDRLAVSTAAVQWGLFREARPDERPEDRTRVTSHAALDLWNRPNPFFTRQLLVETVQQHYELVGEGWLVVSRHPAVRSIPLELWPVSPSRMTPIPDRDNYLVGYIYSSPDGEQIPLELDEVIHIRRPNPIDPYRGIGAVQTILADLEGVQLSAEWNRNFFRNSAEPGGIIQVPDRLEDEQFNELRERWNEQHKGVGNAHRVAIIEHGQWVDRNVSQRDMQFAELRAVSRDVIREAFGITKFAIGDVEDINRATGEAAKTWFAEQMTEPRAERWRQALNGQLLPMYGTTGKGVEFDYDSPVPEDADAENAALTAKSNAAALLATTGYDPAGVLETVGLPPMKWVGPPASSSIPLPRDTPAPPAARLRATQVLDEPRALPAPEDIEAANRWVAVAHRDDNTCKPCLDNDGQLYKNRAAAYEDYPGGEGYIHCEGPAHGHACRCKVVKRRKGDDGKGDDG